MRRRFALGFVLALVPCARAAVIPNPAATEAAATPAPAPPAPEETPAPAPPKISYTGGLLTIDAVDATLADLLMKVGLATGVTIDLPPGASSARMPVVQVGPGPARQVLASLLSDTSFDYLIQASDTDPEKIQSVMVLVREKKGSGPNGMDAPVRPSRSPYARGVPPPSQSDDAPAPENPAPVQVENPVADANPQPAAATQPDPSAPRSSSQPGQFPQLDPNATRPGALSPPSDLSPQNISQQLQQMYQQRAQMIQQNNQAAAQQAPPANGTGK